MSESQSLTVVEADAGKRIDLVIGERLKLSRAKLRDLFEADAIRLDGRRAKKGISVKAGQVIEVREVIVVAPVTEAKPEIELVVLHEDDALIFLEKPSGVPSQPLTLTETGTMASALIARDPAMLQVSTDAKEGGLCHRLDIETSGVLLAAKTRDAWEKMRAAFGNDGDIDKRYLALVTGPLADDGEIDIPLAQRGDHVKPVIIGDEGRPAHSQFQVKARKGEYSLVEVRILSGVMHQVRAHLAAVGAPIVGDVTYGGRELPGLNRFFLHAAALTVTHPVTGKKLEVKSELPVMLREVLKSLGM